MRNRRELLLSVGRWLALAGLGALGGVLLWSSGGESSDPSCSRQALCHGCSRFAGCDLPQAVMARRGEGGGGETGNG